MCMDKLEIYSSVPSDISFAIRAYGEKVSTSIVNDKKSSIQKLRVILSTSIHDVIHAA